MTGKEDNTNQKNSEKLRSQMTLVSSFPLKTANLRLAEKVWGVMGGQPPSQRLCAQRTVLIFTSHIWQMDVLIHLRGLR